MATAKIERALAAKGEGCLGRAADDEPVFILRAKDITAPAVLEFWIRCVEAESYRGTMATHILPAVSPKLQEAQALAHAMREWQDLHGCKVPD